ncbi:MAG: cell division protein FtsQ/DivIB [Nitrospiraceae bacterium]
MFVALTAWGGLVGYQKAAPHVVRWFEVREITVAGANQVTKGEVLERLALKPGQNLLSLYPRRLAIRVQSHPWIKQATVSRVWPHTLAIDIVERRAAAVLRSSSMALLLDDEAHALSVLPPANDPGLPVLVGLNPKDVLDKERRPLQAAQRGIELAGLLGRTFSGRPEVDVGNPDNVVAYVEGLRLQFGGSSFEEKWDRFHKLEPYLPEGRSVRGEIHSDIDLRYPGKVIVRDRG